MQSQNKLNKIILAKVQADATVRMFSLMHWKLNLGNTRTSAETCNHCVLNPYFNKMCLLKIWCAVIVASN